jgi:plastocyanin domain-containing protein
MIGMGLVALLGAAACEGGGSKEKESASTQGSKAKRVEVKVDASGYEPSEVKTQAGQPLELVFTRTTDKGCGDVVSIPSMDIEKKLPVGKPVAVKMTPGTAGDMRFTCGMDMYEGKIVVK